MEDLNFILETNCNFSLICYSAEKSSNKNRNRLRLLVSKMASAKGVFSFFPSFYLLTVKTLAYLSRNISHSIPFCTRSHIYFGIPFFLFVFVECKLQTKKIIFVIGETTTTIIDDSNFNSAEQQKNCHCRLL